MVAGRKIKEASVAGKGWRVWGARGTGGLTLAGHEWCGVSQRGGTLRWAGHEGYVVGGAVRDLLLGLQPKDFDIVTSATPKQASPCLPVSPCLSVHVTGG